MQITPQEQETDLLQVLRREYEERGYTFDIHPTDDRLPAFLRNYRPAAIATSKIESIVIEVKARREAKNEPGLSDIARLVEKEPGWKFKVYYQAATVPRLYDVPTKKIVTEQITEARKLFDSGHARAAFIMAWAALEAAARAVNVKNERGRVMMPRELVEWLAYAGIIDRAASRALRDLVTVRNAIVHGAAEVVTKKTDFEFLCSVVQSVINEIETVTTERSRNSTQNKK